MCLIQDLPIEAGGSQLYLSVAVEVVSGMGTSL